MSTVSQVSTRQLPLPTLLKILVISGSVIAIYRTDLEAVFSEAVKSELSSYALVLPFLIGYILYRKRNALTAAIAFDLNNRRTSLEILSGATLMGFALTLYWNGSFSSLALEYRMISLPLFMIGALSTLFGWTTLRAALFPVFLLFFLTPIPVEISANLGGVLSVYTTAASLQIVRLLGVSATSITVYETPAVQFDSLAGGQVIFVVSIVCSGLYSLTGFAAFAAFASYIPKGRNLAKVTLFLVGFALVYSLNILRVAVILMIGRLYGEGAALSVFHTFGGTILIFMGTLGLLYLGEKVWRLRFRGIPQPPPHNPHDTTNASLLGGFCSLCGSLVRFPKRALSKLESFGLAIIVIMTILIVLAQTPLIAYAQGPNSEVFFIPPGNAAPDNLLPILNNTWGTWTPEFAYRDIDFERVTCPYATACFMDAAWVFGLYPERTKTSYPVVRFSMEVAPTKTYLDPPEVSLIYSRQSLSHLPNATFVFPSRDSFILDSPSVIGTLFVYRDGVNNNISHVIYYWYERATFRKGNSYTVDYIKANIITTVNELANAGIITDQNNQTQIEEVMLSFARPIVQYWEPAKSASTLAQYLASTRRTVLPFLTVAIGFGTVFSVYLGLASHRKSDEITRITSKLRAPEDRSLIDAIHTQKSGVTLEEAQEAMSASGYTLTEAELLAKIMSAEKLGVVRRALTIDQDRAAQRWRYPHGIRASLRRFLFDYARTLRIVSAYKIANRKPTI